MITLERKEALPKWQQWWGELQSNWFKVEVLQDYSAEDKGPSLTAWINGDKAKALQFLREKKDLSWHQSKPEVERIRIHVIDEPMSHYLQWEIEAYKNINIPIGHEKIYLVHKSKTANLNLPDGDFCIFDGKRVVKNTYDRNGFCVRMDFYEEDEDISYFQNLQDGLLELAEPISKY